MQSNSLKNGNKLEKNITRMQAFVGLVLLLITIVGAWMSITSQYKQDGKDFENHEIRIKMLEDNNRDFKDDLKEIKASQQLILIAIQNKQDRK